MRVRAAILTSLMGGVLLAGAVSAQEGHPLKGSWLGTWGPSADHLNDVLIIMDWDGENITGMINPGTDNIPIENARLDPDGWVLRFEAQGQDPAGNPLNYVIEGRIENLAFHNRAVVGTWTHQNGTGPFEIERQ